MTVHETEATAQALVAKGKGLLAADESFGTIAKRFDSVGIESTEENRQAYREMLFTTPGFGEFISGVIMFDETVRQRATDGRPFSDVITAEGVIPGIKVDKGAKQLAGSPSEKVTEGLDGLRERLAEYVDFGARFTKWRAVITIGDGLPTRACLEANAHALARFATLSQEAGLVPIVEPEVLIDGDHTIERCFQVTEDTLRHTFEQLYVQGVVPERMVLKPSMVQPGKDCPTQVGPDEIAKATVDCYLRTVPAAVPGIAMLSGGQSDQRATENLNAMNRRGWLPWELTFSYARALQDVPMKTWRGDAANVGSAQKAFYHRARCNSAAHEGTYSKEMELSPQ